MNSMNRTLKLKAKKLASGMTLLDVLLAIVIFVIGMLALAHLQTNLTRSSTDSTTRTVAGNIGEELLEAMRAFQLVRTDPDGTLFAFADIDADYVSRVVPRGGINYTVTGTVNGYDFADDGIAVTVTSPAVAGEVYDFKVVELSVAWDSAVAFQVDEGQQVTGNDLGTGNIVLRGVIPSIPPLASAKLASVQDPAGAPVVPYLPGALPDVVPVNLGDDKYRESSSPEPEVRKDLSETWFDVVTYSKVNQDATFLRREEYVAIQCECVLKAPSGDDKDGLGAAVWTGAEYKVGEMVGKPYGEQDSTGGDQSLYCDVCCRDHHDSDSDPKYRPWMQSNEYINGGALDNDHPHFYVDKDGVRQLSVPFSGNGNLGDENTYLEACRLVRKDGFFRVVQDFHLREQITLPEDHFGDVSEYSNYVKALAHSDLGPGTDPGAAEDYLTYVGKSPDASIPVTQSGRQLMARGVYIDASNSALDANLYNCFDGNGSRSDCEVPGATSVYELYPFFDIQITFLSDWKETLSHDPVNITSDQIPTNITGRPIEPGIDYSRGKAELAGSQLGGSIGHSEMEGGNAGLINIVPIESVPAPVFDTSDIYLIAGDDPEPPPPSGDPVISGILAAQAGTSQATDLIITESPADAVICEQALNTFECTIDLSALIGDGQIRVSNYWKNSNTPLIVCGDGLTLLDYHIGTDSLNDPNWTEFELPLVTTSGITLRIIKGSSPADC